MDDDIDWSRFTATDEARDDFLGRVLLRTNLSAMHYVLNVGRPVPEAVRDAVKRMTAGLVRDGAPSDLVAAVAEMLHECRSVMEHHCVEIIERAAEARRARSAKPRRAPRSSKADALALPPAPEEVQL